MYRQARWGEPLIFELDSEGRRGALVPRLSERVKKRVGGLSIPEKLRRGGPPEIPRLSEVQVVRHYTRLSESSYGVDSGPLPLGSCTMKYNPRLPLKYLYSGDLDYLHPLMGEEHVQGILEIAYRLQEWLKEILGMDICSVHPAAGAQGELAGVLVIRKYHELRGLGGLKDEIVVPDSAHGTNPASAAMANYRVVEVPTGSDGSVDLEALRAAVTDRTAGLMLTNPNTLGLFEPRIREIAELIHGVGGLMYYDGANLNGILGYARPGDMGFDIAHVNLHKTFGVPHGGGGPGAGPVCVKDVEVVEGVRLSDLLPGPIVVYDEGEGAYKLRGPGRWSVGMLRPWLGNVGALLWAYVYIASLGAEGLKRAGELSVLNTNYFMSLMEGSWGYEVPYGPERPRKHEVVISSAPLRDETGVTAEDVAKGLLDSGFHAPTIYFPLMVEEALMIEFTESESMENIEAYAARLREIADIARRSPEEPGRWPANTSVSRLDMVKANHPRSVTPSWRIERLRREGRVKALK